MNKATNFRYKSNMSYYENISYFDCAMEKYLKCTRHYPPFRKYTMWKINYDKHDNTNVKQNLNGSKNVREQQIMGQKRQNMPMNPLLIAEQSTLESRYTQRSGVHYLRESNAKDF